ncbi:hypothetical protein CTAYLR_003366 [Chrysophaeum taylorii]|uniref:C2 domain-containing protein n=1 Tax=Chrysophaeum taylorii TaxID=2483200 RepID=A0AAD7UEU2_9STRA|nr:hypothetical protein CTAYLR_003366 [Chrysophaeum taylorii]
MAYQFVPGLGDWEDEEEAFGPQALRVEDEAGMPANELVIWLYRGRDLRVGDAPIFKNADSAGSSDPQCIFRLYQTGLAHPPTIASRVIEKSLKPVWNDTLTLPVVDPPERGNYRLEVEVRDVDVFDSDFLGRFGVTFSAKEVETHAIKLRATYELERGADVDLDITGSIDCAFRWRYNPKLEVFRPDIQSDWATNNAPNELRVALFRATLDKDARVATIGIIGAGEENDDEKKKCEALYASARSTVWKQLVDLPCQHPRRLNPKPEDYPTLECSFGDDRSCFVQLLPLARKYAVANKTYDILDVKTGGVVGSLEMTLVWRFNPTLPGAEKAVNLTAFTTPTIVEQTVLAGEAMFYDVANITLLLHDIYRISQDWKTCVDAISVVVGLVPVITDAIAEAMAIARYTIDALMAASLNPVSVANLLQRTYSIAANAKDLFTMYDESGLFIDSILSIQTFVVVVMDVMARGCRLYQTHYAKVEKKERNEAQSLFVQSGGKLADFDFKPEWAERQDMYPKEAPNVLYFGLSRARDLAIKDEYAALPAISNAITYMSNSMLFGKDDKGKPRSSSSWTSFFSSSKSKKNDGATPEEKKGSSDPSMRVTVHAGDALHPKSTWRSTSKQKTLNPVWNEFEKFVVSPPNSIMKEKKDDYVADLGGGEGGGGGGCCRRRAWKPKGRKLVGGMYLERARTVRAEKAALAQQYRIDCYVEDIDWFSENDFMGFVSMDLLALRDHKVSRKWHLFEKKPPDYDNTETVKKQESNYWWNDDDDNEAISGDVELVSRWLYEPEADPWTPEFPRDGVDVVHVGLFHARHLPALDSHVMSQASSDPLIQFTLVPKAEKDVKHDKKNKRPFARSKAKPRTLYPVWREVLSVQKINPAPLGDHLLRVKMEDKDLLGSDFIGSVDFDLADLTTQISRHTINLTKLGKWAHSTTQQNEDFTLPEIHLFLQLGEDSRSSPLGSPPRPDVEMMKVGGPPRPDFCCADDDAPPVACRRWWRRGFLRRRKSSKKLGGGPPAAEAEGAPPAAEATRGIERAATTAHFESVGIMRKVGDDITNFVKAGVDNVKTVTTILDHLKHLKRDWHEILKSIAYVQNSIPKIVSALETLESIVQLILKAVAGIAFPPNPAHIVDWLHTFRKLLRQGESIYEVYARHDKLKFYVGELSEFAERLVDTITKVANLSEEGCCSCGCV